MLGLDARCRPGSNGFQSQGLSLNCASSWKVQEHLVQALLYDQCGTGHAALGHCSTGRSQCSGLLWPQVSGADPVLVLLLGQLTKQRLHQPCLPWHHLSASVGLNKRCQLYALGYMSPSCGCAL